MKTVHSPWALRSRNTVPKIGGTFALVSDSYKKKFSTCSEHYNLWSTFIERLTSSVSKYRATLATIGSYCLKLASSSNTKVCKAYQQNGFYTAFPDHIEDKVISRVYVVGNTHWVPEKLEAISMKIDESPTELRLGYCVFPQRCEPLLREKSIWYLRML